jgi:endonuclease/exonuclease/phosphatase family metal-dependent hydrolase
MSSFRVATYNVHKCRGLDWRIDVRRVAAVISAVNPDVLAVQEITARQADGLSEATGIPHVFGGVRDLNGEAYGNAAFSRAPIVQSEQYDLTVPGRESRGCLRIQVGLTPGISVQFFAVHLGTSLFERQKQGKLLTSPAVLGHPGHGTCRILAGDLNEWKRGLTTRLLLRHMQCADLHLHTGRRRSYPPLLPLVHLDHIYYDRAFQVKALELYRTPAAMIASDHLPLVCDFEPV